MPTATGFGFQVYGFRRFRCGFAAVCESEAWVQLRSLHIHGIFSPGSLKPAIPGTETLSPLPRVFLPALPGKIQSPPCSTRCVRCRRCLRCCWWWCNPSTGAEGSRKRRHRHQAEHATSEASEYETCTFDMSLLQAQAPEIEAVGAWEQQLRILPAVNPAQRNRDVPPIRISQGLLRGLILLVGSKSLQWGQA